MKHLQLAPEAIVIYLSRANFTADVVVAQATGLRPSRLPRIWVGSRYRWNAISLRLFRSKIR